jgi:sortase A
MTLLDRPKSQSGDPVEYRVKQMETVRRLASQIIEGPDATGSSLPDEEWESLCSYARGSSNESVAIARVIEQAHRRRPAGCWVPIPSPQAAPARTVGTERPTVTGPVEMHPRPGSIGTPLPVESPVPSSFALPVTGTTAPIEDERDSEWVAYAPPSVPSITAKIIEVRRSSPKEKRLHRRGTTTVAAIDDRRRERWLSIASWVRNIGVIILLFVVWQLWGTAITQHHSQAQLKNQFQAKVGKVEAKPAFRLVPSTTKIADPPQGTVMAQIQIPKIDLSQYVVSGTDEDDLAKGPGHYLGTAMPGQAGNVAIAGHRTTHGAPFNRLAELAVGDPIYLTTLGGQRLTYIVSAVPVPVSPSDVTVLNDFGDNRLTLTTCNPEYSAIQRLIVVAAYLPPGATHPEPIAKGTGTPYQLAPAAVSGWNTSLLPLVLLFGGLLVAIGLLNRRLSRIYGREGRWLILGPVWMALLLALFQTLTSFLPSSV